MIVSQQAVVHTHTKQKRGARGLFWRAAKLASGGNASEMATYRVRLSTDAELWEYCDDVLNFRIPKRQCCSGHTPPFTAFATAYFGREPMVIWLGSRGMAGKSAHLAALSMVEAVTLGAGVTLLGGSAEQSNRVLAYMQGTDSNLPTSYWHSPNAGEIRGLVSRDISRRTSLLNGGWIHALAASTRSARGPHPQRLRLDEVDEMAWEIYDAATGQPMSLWDPVTQTTRESQTVASSTWHYPDKTMTKLLELAPQKKWPVFEWCYRESMAG